MGKKIATCSYCGTRAILVLDKARHELSCKACGAPLHDMKFMPQHVETRPKSSVKTVSKPKPKKTRTIPANMPLERKSRPKKKRKSLFSKVLEEVWDEVEDFFD